MNIVELLQDLANKDIRLWLEDEQLRFSAPEGAMTGDVISLLKTHKPSIISFLSEQSGQSTTFDIPEANRSEDLPLSAAQQRLWFLQQLDPSSDAYHIFGALKLTGPLDIEKLQASINIIMSRHESLRSSIKTAQGKAFIDINSDCSYSITQATHSEINQEKFLEQELSKSFDLENAPLFRAGLFSTENSHEHILSICLHHLIADGWSLGIILKELVTLYAGGTESASILPELSHQYVDYAAWQNSEDYQEQASKEKQYWFEQLSGTPALELPFDHNRKTLEENGARHSWVIPQQTSARVFSYLKEQETTLFGFLISTYACLLNKLTGQNDFAIGSPVAGRMHSDLESIIGCFVNTQAHRFEIEPDLNFKQLLKATTSNNLKALDHQSLAFEDIVQHLTLEGSLERNIDISPIFQTLFVLQNAPLEQMSIEDLSVAPLINPNQDAQFPLALNAIEIDNTIQLNFLYQPSHFKASSIERFATYFDHIINQALSSNSTAINQLQLLTDDDKAFWLNSNSGFNATATNFESNDKSVLDSFEATVETHPELIAVSYEEQSLTFKQLDDKANQLANYLIEQSLSGHCVALYLERSIELSISLLAIHKAGCCYLPIDTQLPLERINFILLDSNAKAIITQETMPLSTTDISLEQLNLNELGTQISQQASSKPGDIKPHELFNIIYTSGSTGQPKGVQVTQSGILNRLQWMQSKYPLTHSDKVLQKTPYSFDVSVWELFWPLMVGAQIVYAKPDGHKDPNYLKSIIQDKSITTLHFVPSMLGQFLQTSGIEALSSIKTIFTSGEALLKQHVQGLREQLPHASLSNLYGPTEAAIDVSYFDCSNAIDLENINSVPIGKPIANTQLYILNSELQLQPTGVAGELYIGGVNLAKGYLNREDLNQTSFINNPFKDSSPSSSQKLYKTGDKARLLEDGNIEYLGRLDFQVKLRGLRIELGEISQQLNAFNSIKDSTVIVINDILVAYIQTETDVTEADNGWKTLINELQNSLKDKLPTYMIPQKWIHIDQWPLTPNGKLNRGALPKPSAELIRQHEFAAPITETQIKLANIWQQVLNVEEISIHDNFFELGGHSLTATQAYTLAQEAFGIELPLRDIFDAPTIDGIAQLIDQRIMESEIFNSSNEQLDDDQDEEMESFIL